MDRHKLQSRYAQSLFDLSEENKISDKVYEDTLSVMEVCLQNHELRTVLKNPIIKPSQKRAILSEIFSNRVQELTLAFMNLLVSKRRDVLLYEIAERYTEIYKEHNNITTVQLTTAETLEQETLQRISRKIEQELHSKIDLQTKVNPSLIGGFCLFVNGKQYDASIANQFSKLRKDFTRNEYERTF